MLSYYNNNVWETIQWIPLNRDRFLQPKKSRLTKNPLCPKLFIYCYLVNGFLIEIPINRKSPLTESRLTGIHCISLCQIQFITTQQLTILENKSLPLVAPTTKGTMGWAASFIPTVITRPCPAEESHIIIIFMVI